jgi:hypothetical protein
VSITDELLEWKSSESGVGGIDGAETSIGLVT